jgi:hypothetical protein
MTRGEQQLVAVAQRDVELLGEMDDHLRTRPCPPGLDEADMPGGHVRLERKCCCSAWNAASMPLWPSPVSGGSTSCPSSAQAPAMSCPRRPASGSLQAAR